MLVQHPGLYMNLDRNINRLSPRSDRDEFGKDGKIESDPTIKAHTKASTNCLSYQSCAARAAHHRSLKVTLVRELMHLLWEGTLSTRRHTHTLARQDHHKSV
jgi:hypothetical protein